MTKLKLEIISSLFFYSGKMFPWCRKEDNFNDAELEKGGRSNEGFAFDNSDQQEQVIISSPNQKVKLMTFQSNIFMLQLV